MISLVAALLLVAGSACVEEPGGGNPVPPPQPKAPVSGAPAQSPPPIAIGGGPAQPGATPTPYFANYWGQATLDGAPVPVGAVVEALDPRGALAGRFVVNTAGYFGYMRVFGEDATATPPIPGMKAGETVTFKINGEPAVTKPSLLVWQNDPTPVQVDLAAPAPVAPTALPMNTPTAPAPGTPPGAPTPGTGSPIPPIHGSPGPTMRP